MRLRVAFQFGILYALIVFVVKASIVKLGAKGVFWISGLSGLIDLDAITLSLSQMTVTGNLGSHVTMSAILIAIFANTALKVIVAAFFGSPALFREVGTVLGITSAVESVLFVFYAH